MPFIRFIDIAFVQSCLELPELQVLKALAYKRIKINITEY